MLSKQDLRGGTAVITGAGSGIGAALATELAEHGMRVVVADIDVTAAQRVATELAAQGLEARAVRVDITDPGSVEALAREAYGAYGSVELLCNNAGVLLFQSVLNATIGDWRWLSAVNVEGTLNCLHAFVPRMRAQTGWRHITNTASTHAYLPEAGETALYSATKQAIVTISRALRAELEPEGIGVTTVCPGQVSTMILGSQRHRPEAFGPPVEEPFGTGVMPYGIDPREVACETVAGILANSPIVFALPNRSEYRTQVEVGWRDIDDELAAGADIPVPLDFSPS